MDANIAVFFLIVNGKPNMAYGSVMGFRYSNFLSFHLARFIMLNISPLEEDSPRAYHFWSPWSPSQAEEHAGCGQSAGRFGPGLRDNSRIGHIENANHVHVIYI